MAKMGRHKVKPTKVYSILPSMNRISGFKMLCLNKWERVSGIVVCEVLTQKALGAAEKGEDSKLREPASTLNKSRLTYSLKNWSLIQENL